MACLHLLRKTIDCAIYVDTGKSYPETQKMIEYAETIVPVITLQSDREDQNEREGIPADVVPIDWTPLGHAMTGKKPVLVQSYLQCCFENIGYPLITKAYEIGATHMIYGQRNDEKHKATSRDGDMVGGITRVHPIENWTSKDVLDYLATQMEVPPHFHIKHSSLDCYDCTAFSRDSGDRVAFTKAAYPEFHREYEARIELVKQALASSGYMENGHA